VSRVERNGGLGRAFEKALASSDSFGLTWNATLETGGILVGDEVTINLDGEFVKA
jgi:hypothetical protein